MAWLQEDPSGNFHVSFRFGGRKFKRSLRTSKGAVTDELLHQVQHGKISWAAFRERTGGYFTSPSRSRQNAMSPEEGAAALLYDIFHHPDDGVNLAIPAIESEC